MNDLWDMTAGAEAQYEGALCSHPDCDVPAQMVIRSDPDGPDRDSPPVVACAEHGTKFMDMIESMLSGVDSSPASSRAKAARKTARKSRRANRKRR